MEQGWEAVPRAALLRLQSQDRQGEALPTRSCPVLVEERCATAAASPPLSSRGPSPRHTLAAHRPRPVRHASQEQCALTEYLRSTPQGPRSHTPHTNGTTTGLFPSRPHRQ